MRCARIRNGVVVNVEIADPATDHELIGSASAQIGDSYANDVFTPSAPAAPVYQTSDLDFLAFMALFTPAEQITIAASDNEQVRLFNLMATGAVHIDLADPRVMGGVGYLASIGLIASGRVAIILSGAPPA